MLYYCAPEDGGVQPVRGDRLAFWRVTPCSTAVYRALHTRGVQFGNFNKVQSLRLNRKVWNILSVMFERGCLTKNRPERY